MKQKSIMQLCIVLILIMPGIASAANNTISLKDVMGNPMDAITPFLPQIKWLFGTVWGWVFLVALLCLAIAVAKVSFGAITSNAAQKQEGHSMVLALVSIVFVAVVAAGLLIYMFNTFIFNSV